MKTIVTKFGGSSLSDANQFKKVKNIFFYTKKDLQTLDIFLVGLLY